MHGLEEIIHKNVRKYDIKRETYKTGRINMQKMYCKIAETGPELFVLIQIAQAKVSITPERPAEKSQKKGYVKVYAMHCCAKSTKTMGGKV